MKIALSLLYLLPIWLFAHATVESSICLNPPRDGLKCILSGGGRIYMGEDEITNGKCSIKLQGDGNLVLRRQGKNKGKETKMLPAAVNCINPQPFQLTAAETINTNLLRRKTQNSQSSVRLIIALLLSSYTSAVWTTGSQGQDSGSYFAALQYDANLVVYRKKEKSNTPVYASHSARKMNKENPPALFMNDGRDNRCYLYIGYTEPDDPTAPDYKNIWTTLYWYYNQRTFRCQANAGWTNTSTDYANMDTTLYRTPMTLFEGQAMFNGQPFYSMYLQHDCNLIIFKGKDPADMENENIVFKSGPTRKGNGECKVVGQPTGNLTIFEHMLDEKQWTETWTYPASVNVKPGCCEIIWGVWNPRDAPDNLMGICN